MSNKALLAAIKKNHYQVVRRLLETDACDGDVTADLTAEAALYGHLDLLKLLREYGCPWDHRVTEAAAANNDLEMLEYAHENGCEWFWSASQRAARNGHLDCLRYCLEHGCEWNPMIIDGAVWLGQENCLRYCLEQGYPFIPDSVYHTIYSGHLECLKVFIEYEARIDSDWIDNAHWDCLLFLHEKGYKWSGELVVNNARIGSLRAIRYALDHGLQLTNQELQESLCIAIKRHHFHIVEYLLESEASQGREVEFTEQILQLLETHSQCIDLGTPIWRDLLFRLFNDREVLTSTYPRLQKEVATERLRIQTGIQTLQSILPHDIVRYAISPYL